MTLDGKPIPPLGDGSRAIKDVRLDPQAIGARLSGAPAPAAVPTPTVLAPLRERTERRSTRSTSGETGGNALTAPAPAPSPSPAATAPADL